MDSAEELQQLEITALQSIYDRDFIECPPPTVWKGAARLHEFIIKVYHPDPEHASKICLHLHVKFPKTYPNLAGPIFTLEKPITGLNGPQVTKLSHEVNLQVQKLRGSEMVFTIVTFCQDWIASNVTPPKEVVGSLAIQMNQRVLDEERARHEREMEEAEREEERANRAAQELDGQIQADAMRQLVAKEQQYKARKRANSETTEVPFMGEGDFQVPTEVFGHEMEINGARFNAVNLFHPRSAGFGIVYTAIPLVDEIVSMSPLELYIVTFESQYYATTQGRKKLKQVEQEIQRLSTVRHPKLISVYAVKLHIPHSSGPPQLMVLSEQLPALTLHDVLEDSECLREDRVSDYLSQILTALNAIHITDFVHRGISSRCIGLIPRDSAGQPKAIKLGKVAYHTRLLDLHRSNSFGPHTPIVPDEYQVPEAWLSREVLNESSLLYTRQRDIHAVGIVLLQMLMGLDVMERFPDAQTAIHASSISPLLARQALNMLQPYRKNHVTCLSLLSELAEAPSRSASINRPMSTSNDLRSPLSMPFGSPEIDYFRGSGRVKPASSRWKEDWEELELLGKGAFGSVVKARNKIDSRIYAVKKIRLKTMQSDTKIFREVNALSRLSHRNIVRYYTTWVETSEPQSTVASDDSSSEFVTEDGRTSVPETSERHLPINGGFSINIEDFDDLSGSRSSFPSIHFGRSGSPGTSGEDSSEDDGFSSLFRSASSGSVPSIMATPTLSRTLYIQMEFVERQTLKELVDEGISEDEAWRLFLQIVDALSHMSTHTILHRDIKLTNIFIDAQGDCKVGDFGLATSSLAAVDPSDVSPHAVTFEADMTLEVGTRLYIAPEVQSRKRGPRNHSKADMYSLGIVFFEMNYAFTTGAERIAVLEDIRKPGIYFPSGWDAHRTRQREIISLLLQHEPDKRPTALELSQSPLLPSRLEDEYFKGALRMMAKSDSPHHQTVLNSLFKQSPRPSRAYLYDIEADPSEYASLNNIVQDRLAALFHLHGAVDMEPPLLMPVLDPEADKNQAVFIDRHGDIVALPNNILVPFARLAARGNIKRIKRFHITNVFRPNPVAGHPKVLKAAVFDIITPDLEYGPVAASAEIIAVASDCLDNFPNLAQNYDIHISHSKLVEIALNRVTVDARSSVTEILLQSKSTPAQKRALLLKKGLPRTTIDELEILSEVEEDIDDILARLEKASPTISALMQPAVTEIKSAIQYAQAANIKRPIYFHPLMLGSHHTHFKDGILVEVVRRHKHTDVLAAGGRYDSLITRLSQLKPKPEPICALGIQIAVEKITAALVAYQSASLRTLVKEERSFGFWSPRRCDVYVVSYQSGYLQDRLDVVSFLWQHNISADLMYESGLPEGDHESHLDICAREGILFTVYPRARNVRNLPAFKVKSILKGTEVDLSRQELVGWLQHQIADQKRLDATTSGAQNILDTASNFPVMKDTAVIPDVHLVLPDPKKQRKTVRQIFLDKAFEKAVAIKTSFQNGMPVLVVDLTPAQFEVMTRSSSWIVEEEAWKCLCALFQQSQMNYALTIREAAIKRKAEGHSYILLFAVREDRAQLLSI